MLEMEENVRSWTLHQLKVVSREFERGFLEPKIARRTAYDETEIYMDDVTVVVD